MPRADRVIVIGAGIVGAAIAFYLADAGPKVILVDDQRQGRASFAGAGIIPHPWSGRGSARYELQSRAVAAYPAIAGRIGASLDTIGELFVAPTGPVLEEAHAALKRNVPCPVERMDPEAAHEAFPYLTPKLGAVYLPAVARVDGEQFRRSLVHAARAAGADVMTGVAEVVVGTRGVEAIRLGRRLHPAESVVVAAGCWSAEVVRPAGVSLAVAPQRGQIIHLGVAEETGSLPAIQPIGVDHYLLPFADRRVVVGATRESGSGFDPRLTAAGVLDVLRDALRVAPGLATATVRELRVGLRPLSPDGDPLLGPIPDCPGLWVATGMGPAGLTLGPYSGQMVANAVLGHPTDVDLAPFNPLRVFS